ncbi:MAG: DUF5667 domain-containing protein [Chloroflexota bacterium]|nr:DUF5667 domain-containing protein [Chloroflexota bacterium]
MREIEGYDTIVERLEELRGPVYRDPKTAATARERYLVQIEEMAPRSHQRMSFVARLVLYWKGQSEMFRKVASIALVIIMLLVGTGVTVQASQSSLPGDRLYSVKRFSENVRQKLTVGQAADAELAVRLATRRIREVTLLAERCGAAGQIEPSIKDLALQLSEAIERIQALEQINPERARMLAQQLNEALTQNQQALEEIGKNAPPPVKAKFINALGNNPGWYPEGVPAGERGGRPDDAADEDDFEDLEDADDEGQDLGDPNGNRGDVDDRDDLDDDDKDGGNVDDDLDDLDDSDEDSGDGAQHRRGPDDDNEYDDDGAQHKEGPANDDDNGEDTEHRDGPGEDNEDNRDDDEAIGNPDDGVDDDGDDGDDSDDDDLDDDSDDDDSDGDDDDDGDDDSDDSDDDTDDDDDDDD